MVEYVLSSNPVSGMGMFKWKTNQHKSLRSTKVQRQSWFLWKWEKMNKWAGVWQQSFEHRYRTPYRRDILWPTESNASVRLSRRANWFRGFHLEPQETLNRCDLRGPEKTHLKEEQFPPQKNVGTILTYKVLIHVINDQMYHCSFHFEPVTI